MKELKLYSCNKLIKKYPLVVDELYEKKDYTIIWNPLKENLHDIGRICDSQLTSNKAVTWGLRFMNYINRYLGHSFQPLEVTAVQFIV